MRETNLELLKDAARLLRPVLAELVFVGGSITSLLITDQAAAQVRSTYDVDAIAEITSYAGYAHFSQRLRDLGFTEDTSEGAPICRWRQHGTTLDIMPLDEKILGFSNRWYKEAMQTAEEHELEPGLRVQVLTAVLFMATKLEAFKGRGKADYASSPDLEDLIAVVDGRAELREEIQTASEQVRAFVSAAIRALLKTPAFIDALPGYLLPDSASQSRLSTVLQRLEGIARA